MEVSLLFKIWGSGHSGICPVPDSEAQPKRRAGIFLTSLTGLLLVLFWVLPYIYDLFTTIQDLFAL